MRVWVYGLLLSFINVSALYAYESLDALPTEAEVEAELFGQEQPTFSGLLTKDSLCHPDLFDLLDPELAEQDKPSSLIVQLKEFGEQPNTALRLGLGDWAEGFGQGVTASIELFPKFLFLLIHQLRYNLDGEDVIAFTQDPWQNGALPLLQAQHQATLGMWCEGREHNHPEMMGMATGNIAMNLVFMKGGYDLTKQMLMKRFSGTGASRVSGGLLARLLQPGLRGSHLGLQTVLIDVIPIKTITPLVMEGASLGAAATLPGMSVVVYSQQVGDGGEGSASRGEGLSQEELNGIKVGDTVEFEISGAGDGFSGTVQKRGYLVQKTRRKGDPYFVKSDELQLHNPSGPWPKEFQVGRELTLTGKGPEGNPVAVTVVEPAVEVKALGANMPIGLSQITKIPRRGGGLSEVH